MSLLDSKISKILPNYPSGEMMRDDLLVDFEVAKLFFGTYWVFVRVGGPAFLLWDTDDLFYPAFIISFVDFWVGSVDDKFIPKTDFISSIAGWYSLSL